MVDRDHPLPVVRQCELLDLSRSTYYHVPKGLSITVQVAERRLGDPAVLVADATQAKTALNWQPQYHELDTMIRHAWVWEKKLAGLD